MQLGLGKILEKCITPFLFYMPSEDKSDQVIREYLW